MDAVASPLIRPGRSPGGKPKRPGLPANSNSIGLDATEAAADMAAVATGISTVEIEVAAAVGAAVEAELEVALPPLLLPPLPLTRGLRPPLLPLLPAAAVWDHCRRLVRA